MFISTCISICTLNLRFSGTTASRTSSVVACRLTANAVRILVSSRYRLMLGTMPAVDTVTLYDGNVVEHDSEHRCDESASTQMPCYTAV
jgi:hypothetical protein